MAAVVVSFDGRVYDGAVHALHLAVGPWVVGRGQVVLDVILVADLIEAESPVASLWRLSISGSSCSLHHDDETKTLLKSQSQIWDIGADGE